MADVLIPAERDGKVEFSPSPINGERPKRHTFTYQEYYFQMNSEDRFAKVNFLSRGPILHNVMAHILGITGGPCK